MKVLKGKEKEWGATRLANTNDPYSAIVIVGVLIVGDALDEGKSPEEADKELTEYDLGLTGFQAGAIAQLIHKFHPRGVEYKEWWNNLWSDKPYKNVINPALISLKSKNKEK